VAGGLLYVGSRDGAIHAFDAASGERKWRFQTGEGLAALPRAVLAPRGAGPAEMAAIGLEQERQRAREGRALVTASPIVAEGTVYVGSWDFRMYALDAATGAVRWSFDAGAPVAAGASLYGELLIIATQGKAARIIGLDARTGAQRWAVADPRASRANARRVMRDGVIYLTNWDGAAYVRGSSAENAQAWAQAIDARTGKVLWTTRLRDAWPSPPAVTQQHILFMTTPRHLARTTFLRALDRSSGRELWAYEGRGGANYWKSTDTTHHSRAPLVAGDEMAFFASDVYLSGIELATGKELWRLAEPFLEKYLNQYHLGPLLYAITGDTSGVSTGELLGIETKTGKPAWRKPMPSRNTVLGVLGRVVYVRTSLLGATLVEYDGVTGEELATVWRHQLLGNVSNFHCAGPVRYGNQIYFTTARMEYMGQHPSRGYLYSVPGPQQR
jgi:outer membrane protein assembly factor BamB